MQDHHLQQLEYLVIIQTSFGLWILALHTQKCGNLHCPKEKKQLHFALNKIQLMLWTNQLNVV
jgi:hypothetical protein